MDVVNAALRGIAKSQEEYSTWSGGYWLYEAPEYVTTTNIAREIWSSRNPRHHYLLTLEENVKNVCEQADGETGKVDMALWDPESARTPEGCRAIIEVKRQISRLEDPRATNDARHDIERICALLQRNRSLRFGAMTFCMAHSDENNDDERMKQVLCKRVIRMECDAAKLAVGSRSMGLSCHWSVVTRDCLRNRAWLGGVIKVTRQ